MGSQTQVRMQFPSQFPKKVTFTFGDYCIIIGITYVRMANTDFLQVGTEIACKS